MLRVDFRWFLKDSRYLYDTRGGFKGIIDSWNRHSPDAHQSLKNRLLHGLVSNRRESRIAKNSADIVVPTVSLLGGIAILQPTAAPTNLRENEVHTAFVDQLGSRVTKLGHMLENPANLGVHDGRVKFVDGGSKGLETLVMSDPALIAGALGSLTLQHASKD